MTESEAATQIASSGKKTRERSSIQFPYVDLDAATALASAMYNEQGAASCDLDQLSSWSGHETADSGTFRNKVQAARYFGLITVEHQRVRLTPLGRDILEPQTERSARVRSFLTVGLYKKLFETYRGRTLPRDVGLENEMKTLGVAAKQANKARQAFRRSAGQAGLFAQGPDRLVLPSNVDLSAPASESGKDAAQVEGDKSKSGSGTPPPSGIHPMIRMLLNALPPASEIWTIEDQEVWLDLMRGVFAQIYRPSPEQDELVLSSE